MQLTRPTQQVGTSAGGKPCPALYACWSFTGQALYLNSILLHKNNITCGSSNASAESMCCMQQPVIMVVQACSVLSFGTEQCTYITKYQQSVGCVGCVTLTCQGWVFSHVCSVRELCSGLKFHRQLAVVLDGPAVQVPAQQQHCQFIPLAPPVTAV